MSADRPAWVARYHKMSLKGVPISNCPECKNLHSPPRPICPDCGFNVKTKVKSPPNGGKESQ